MVDDIGMPRNRIVTLRLVFSLFCNQNINDGSGAYFETGLGGFQRAFC